MEPLWPMPKDDDDLLHKSVRFETSRAKLEEHSSFIVFVLQFPSQQVQRLLVRVCNSQCISLT